MRSSGENKKDKDDNQKPQYSRDLQWVKAWLDHVRKHEGGGIPKQKIYRTIQDTIAPKSGSPVVGVAPKECVEELQKENFALFRKCFSGVVKKHNQPNLSNNDYFNGLIEGSMEPYFEHLYAKARNIYDEVMRLDEEVFANIFKDVELSRQEIAKECAMNYVFGAAQATCAAIGDEYGNQMQDAMVARVIQTGAVYLCGSIGSEQDNIVMQSIVEGGQLSGKELTQVFMKACAQDKSCEKFRNMADRLFAQAAKQQEQFKSQHAAGELEGKSTPEEFKARAEAKQRRFGRKDRETSRKGSSAGFLGRRSKSSSPNRQISSAPAELGSDRDPHKEALIRIMMGHLMEVAGRCWKLDETCTKKVSIIDKMANDLKSEEVAIKGVGTFDGRVFDDSQVRGQLISFPKTEQLMEMNKHFKSLYKAARKAFLGQYTKTFDSDHPQQSIPLLKQIFGGIVNGLMSDKNIDAFCEKQALRSLVVLQGIPPQEISSAQLLEEKKLYLQAVSGALTFRMFNSLQQDFYKKFERQVGKDAATYNSIVLYPAKAKLIKSYMPDFPVQLQEDNLEKIRVSAERVQQDEIRIMESLPGDVRKKEAAVSSPQRLMAKQVREKTGQTPDSTDSLSPPEQDEQFENKPQDRSAMGTMREEFEKQYLPKPERPDDKKENKHDDLGHRQRGGGGVK